MTACSRHKIAVFASGQGSNFEAIVRASLAGEVNADVALLVSDNPSARVCQIAREMGVETFVFAAKDYASKEEYERLIVEHCRQREVELICLAGYMRIVGRVLLEAYRGAIVNIHPSLLPAFAGAKAIEQAVNYGVKVYGVTVHYVNQTLDGGEIIAQQAFGYEGSDIEELTTMIHKVEHKLYIDTIKKLLK